MGSEQTGWDHRYRRLSEGETILPTDECQNDDGSWKVTRPEVAGSKAPNPDYTSHRTYRRLATTPPPASADAMGEVERVARAIHDAMYADEMSGAYMSGKCPLDSVTIDGDVNLLGAATAALSAMSPAGDAEQRGYDRAIAEVVAWLRGMNDRPGLPAFGFKPHDLQGIYGNGFAAAIEAGEHKP